MPVSLSRAAISQWRQAGQDAPAGLRAPKEICKEASSSSRRDLEPPPREGVDIYVS
jgi:hypothetical protein